MLSFNIIKIMLLFTLFFTLSQVLSVNAEINLLMTYINRTSLNVTCVSSDAELTSPLIFIRKSNSVITPVQQVSSDQNNIKCTNFEDCFIPNNNWTVDLRYLHVENTNFESLPTIITDRNENAFLQNISSSSQIYVSFLGKDASFGICELNTFTDDNKCTWVQFDSRTTVVTCSVTSANLGSCRLISRQSEQRIYENGWNTIIIYHNHPQLVIYNKRQELIISNNNAVHNRFVYLFARSASKTLWKIHRINRISTNRANTYLKSKEFNLYSNNFCLSISGKMRKNCRLSVTLTKNNRNETKIITRRNFEENLQFSFPPDSVGPVSFIIKSIEDISNSRNYWNISNVQECSIGYRSINTILPTTVLTNPAEELLCNDVRNDVSISKLNSRILTTCPQGSFGSSCNRSCGQILGPKHRHCEGVVFCNRNGCFNGCEHIGEHFSQIPNQIVNINAVPNERSILVSWDDPRDKYGFRSYSISYKVIRHVGCTDMQPNAVMTTFDIRSNNNYSLTNLNPYTVYHIEIMAVNDFEDQEKSILVQTLPSQAPTEIVEEITLLNKKHKCVFLQWKKPLDCTKIGGKLAYIVQIFTNDRNTLIQSQEVTKETAVFQLSPDTKYVARITTKRFGLSLINKKFAEIEFETLSIETSQMYYLLLLILFVPIVIVVLHIIYKKRRQNEINNRAELNFLDNKFNNSNQSHEVLNNLYSVQ